MFRSGRFPTCASQVENRLSTCEARVGNRRDLRGFGGFVRDGCETVDNAVATAATLPPIRTENADVDDDDDYDYDYHYYYYDEGYDDYDRYCNDYYDYYDDVYYHYYDY